MKKKEKAAPKKQRVRLPKVKKPVLLKKTTFFLLPILPHLLIIAVCIGLYYAMINFYLFFEWGIYIYYAIKLVVGFEILSAGARSYLVPVGALLLGLAVLFTNCIYLTTLMNTDTAWELSIVAFVGILLRKFIEARSSNIK
jgi:hypothetical protein